MSLSHRIVVMNKGKFEQVGTPTEIYDNPHSKYVASFIGEMNFIQDGEKTIAVRPENVNVIVGGSGMINGKVRTIISSDTTYLLTCSAATMSSSASLTAIFQTSWK